MGLVRMTAVSKAIFIEGNIINPPIGIQESSISDSVIPVFWDAKQRPVDPDVYP
jgi:hypothetical protein